MLLTPRPRSHPTKSSLILHQRLRQILSNLQSKQHMIVLCGDFNESIGDDINGLDSLITKHNLTDAVQHLRGSYDCSTYARGSKCLDFIFTSQNVTNSIKQAAILHFNYVISSNHRAIYVDLDTSILFGKDVSPLMSPPS